MGYTQAIIWIFGMGFILRETLKCKSSKGLSPDYILINYMGFLFFIFQDIYGYCSPYSTYSAEVHIPDLIISFVGNIFTNLGMVIICTMPGRPEKIFSNKVIIIWIIMICIVGAVAISTKNLNSTMITAGTCKGYLSL